MRASASDRGFLLCLSSGTRARYRDDIIRALAMPAKARLRFRYDQKWVAEEILENFDSLVGRRVLVGFIDQEEHNVTPQIVPCRTATLTNCWLHGSTSSLEFELSEFAWAEDLDQFNEEMRAVAPSLPDYDDESQLSGHYCLPVDRQPDSLQLGDCDQIADWERIVDEMASRSAFETEPFFYLLKELKEVGRQDETTPDSGTLELDHGREYTLQFYHYHPVHAPQAAAICVEVPDRVGYLATNAQAIVDSRYDLKTLRLVTSTPAKEVSGYLSIARQYSIEGSEKTRSVVDFDLPLAVKGTQFRRALLGLALGALIAGPSITSIVVAPNLSDATRLAASSVAFVVGISAGLVAAFGLGDAAPL